MSYVFSSANSVMGSAMALDCSKSLAVVPAGYEKPPFPPAYCSAPLGAAAHPARQEEEEHQGKADEGVAVVPLLIGDDHDDQHEPADG